MNHSTGKGFSPRLPNKKEIVATRSHFKSIIRNWRSHKLKVVLGYLNALVYRACRHVGVLQRVRRAKGSKKGFHKIVGDIKTVALHGLNAFNITIEGIVDQLQNFWGLKISEASLRKYRYELRDVFGLFSFESEPIPLGRSGDRNNRRPPALQNFDLSLACILLEAIEELLLKERGCEIDEFPGCGAMTKFVYDALFAGIARFRRKVVQDDPVVIYQGDRQVYASEIDWKGTELNARGLVAWYGLASGAEVYHGVP